jgi:hypothetical protein
VLVGAVGLSSAALFGAMQQEAVTDRKPTLDVPRDATHPGTINLGAPSTMVPRIPRLSSSIPGGVINLAHWKLTLPTGDDGDPDEITQPELSRFRDPEYFDVDRLGEGVVFRAPVGGVTTGNSSYPRSELREMTSNGRKQASWSSASGTHVMTISQAITALPDGKAEVVAGQIHDDEDDVVMVRLHGSKLFVEADGRQVGVLDPKYRLGARFTVQFAVADGQIRVTYNGIKTVGMEHDGDGYYFKAGCYTQANEDNADEGSYGEVVIYALSVQHS